MTKNCCTAISSNMKTCLNCDTPRHGDATYCTDCGQAYKELQLSFWQVVKDFFVNVFAIDHKLWTTIAGLMVPGRLALRYVAGKRKSLIPPGRLFFVCLVIHIATLTLFLRVIESKIENSGRDVYRQAEQLYIQELYDSLAIEYIEVESTRDSFRADLFNFGIDTSSISIGELGMIGETVQEYGVSEKDLVTLDPELIIDKYDISSWEDRLFVRQSIRVNTDFVGTIQSVIANFFWLIAIMVFITAVVLKVLYIRHEIFLAEHLIVSAYTHSWQLLIASLLCAGLIGYGYWLSDIDQIEYVLDEGQWIPIYAGPLGLYALFSMKAYYQQGWIRTIVKWILTSALYLMAGLSVFALILTVTLLLF